MRRENVIGDVCHVIELLMEKYQAFPVLESSVGNFESGGKQLELVYKSVSSMYLQGENDARNALRKHHWKGANSWTHPRLLKRIWDNKNKVWHETDTEPLNLYPGAAVHPAGTSQTCQHCGINPVALLRNQKGAPETLPVGEGGEVHLKTEEGRKITLRLYCGKSIKTGQRLKKTQKEQPDYSPDRKPLKAGDYSIEELQRHIRASLRRPHQDPQSRDTKQSWFWCPNKDCRHPPTHADANAAVNIGRKFLAERINLAKVSKR